MDNGIGERQNQSINIMRLAAMRQLYSDAKFLFNFKFFICVILVIVGNVLSFVKTQNLGIHSVIVIIKLVSVVVPFITFDKWINTKRDFASRIQEEFDHNVLKTAWNENKFGATEGSIHEVTKYKRKYEKKMTRKNVEWSDGLKDWYDSSYSQMRLSIGRLHCQFTNINWDSDLRNSFKKILLTLTIGIVAILIVSSMIMNNSFLSSLEYVFLPFTSMIIFLLQAIIANEKTMDELANLKYQVTIIVGEKDKPEVTEDELFKLSNDLQGRIYEYRKNAFLIPDIVYNFFRKRQEDSTKEVADIEKKRYNTTSTD